MNFLVNKKDLAKAQESINSLQDELSDKDDVIEACKEEIDRLHRIIDNLKRENKNLRASINTEKHVAAYFKTKSKGVYKTETLSRGELFLKLGVTKIK